MSGTSLGTISGFPSDFGWGVSTSAYQIEGAVSEDGRGESIWDTFCRQPGTIANGESGDVACDHYHHWQEDLDLLAELGVDLYRFSISWPRVMPTGKGELNQAGVDFYSRLVDGLLERGVKPLITLFHWDLPQTLEDEGGWANRDTAARFGEYAAAMFDCFGDRVPLWLTHNEPWVAAFMGYLSGEKAPGIRDLPLAVAASHHLLLSHGLAVQAYRASAAPSGRIGIAPNLHPTRPYSDSPEDTAAAALWDGFQNRWFLDPIFKGQYPEDVLAEYERRGAQVELDGGDMQTIAAPIDFLGVNFYHRLTTKHDPSSPYLELRNVPTRPPFTEMGWEITPESLADLLLRLRRDYGDIDMYITENGAAFPDTWDGGSIIEDPARVDFLRRHVEALASVVTDDANVKGYCVWSLYDNFEWERGYAMRFGLYYVDYPTQRRIPKRSALWYRDQIAASHRSGSPPS